jgi:enoyl-CoA hydratase
MEVILTGEPLAAQRAYELGLVNRLVEPNRVLGEAVALAQTIASNAPLAVQASRNLASRAFQSDEAALWADGFAAFQKNMQTEDAKEGPRAFIEKRPPRWQAR